MSPFSRRSLLQSAGALAGLSLASRITPAYAQAAEKPALLCIFLNGGYNSLFGSADSFVAANDFGCTASNTKALAGGLVVDASTFGMMPQFAQDHMASVGVRHGLTAHEAAQPALWTTNNRSYPTILAKALAGDAAIKAAVVGGEMPVGSAPTEGDVSLQGITDMKATIVALGGDIDPSVPNRNIATNALISSTAMSQKRLLRSPGSLRSVKDGLQTGVATLQHQGLALDYTGLCQAYGVTTGTTSVSTFRTQMMAAELMVLAGSNVIVAADDGWDTHGDTNGDTVRTMMSQRILPPLNTFISRLVGATGRNVVVTIFGDFARSLPGSDHEGNLTTTVIGKYVKAGTTGRVANDVSLAPGTPGIAEYWSYLAAVTQCATQPFGPNPHTAITLT